jgi:hypothetical protein
LDVDDKNKEKDNENLEVYGIPTLIISPPLLSENVIESPPSIPSNLLPLKKKINNIFKRTSKNSNIINLSTNTLGNTTN